VRTLEESFTTLLGKQPSDKERQAFLRVRDALNLKDNDALWVLLMVLGHYETLYGRFPSLIAKAAADVTENARAAAEAELKAAAARTRSELARSVAQTAQDIAGRVASAQRSKWFLIGVTVAVAAFLGFGGAMFRAGVRTGDSSGRLDGYTKAHDEKAAADWANTPEGQLGYALAKAGSLRELATCSGKNFEHRGDSCFVKAKRESVFGWKLASE
jgi:ElaB/YqjD/DUF883 family membrane-anchored ribosome-binding protein